MKQHHSRDAPKKGALTRPPERQIIYMETWRKELYLTHHGIKGQQWGVRRGPPYPLKSSKTQNVGYVSKGADPNDPERNKPIGDSGKSLSVLSADAKNIAKKYGYPLKSNPTSIGDDIKCSCPEWWDNQNDRHWVSNCTHSIVAFASRRRGLDVSAKPLPDEMTHGRSIIDVVGRYFRGNFSQKDFYRLNFVDGFFSRADGVSYEQQASKRLTKVYKDVPDGGYGVVYMRTVYAGHVFVWYKEDGIVKFADAQAGVNAQRNFENISRYGAREYGQNSIFTARLDNRELNPEYIDEVVKNLSSDLRHTLLLLGGNFKMEPWRRDLYGSLYLMHFGRSKRDGAPGPGSGRYPLGSGKNPKKKWGIHKFQNPDGSLNEEGEKRKKIYDPVNNFAESSNKYYQALKKNHESAVNIGKEGINIGNESLKVYDRFASRRQKPLEDLSQQRINRLNMEQQYHRLTASNEVSKGRQFAEDVLSVGGSALAVTSSALAIALSIKQLRGGV